MNLPAASWVERLGLQPHPEGGYFRRIFTDARTVSTAGGVRAAASSIHYLLDAASPRGRLHRNRSRILHYLQHGGPVRYWLLAADGALTSTTLGVGAGEALFLDVPGGVWKASELVDGADHALVSEVVLPGFDYADHEFMSLSQLAGDHAAHLPTLRHLVRPAD